MSLIAIGKPLVHSRPVWVIADRSSNRRFGLTLNTGRTSLVGFVNRADAFFVGRSLEDFREIHGYLPLANYDGGWSELEYLRSPSSRRKRLNTLDLDTFDTVDHLTEYCKLGNVDACICDEVPRRGKKFDLRGLHLAIESDPRGCCDVWETLLVYPFSCDDV
jgi:hypothetical protein